MTLHRHALLASAIGLALVAGMATPPAFARQPDAQGPGRLLAHGREAAELDDLVGPEPPLLLPAPAGRGLRPRSRATA